MTQDAATTSETRNDTSSVSFEIPRTNRGTPARLVTIFGSLGPNGEKGVHYIFDVGDAGYREISLAGDDSLDSIALQAPAAAWSERELHDQYGVKLKGQPDARPLVFHENWPDGLFPMLGELGEVPWAQRQYHFLQVQGEGVAEVAVGPVHAGIIEPGHFRFSVVGDTILHLELRHFYTHKGTEKLFEGISPLDGTMLAESVSGDNCFAHAVCYCQAVESAHGLDVPSRASALRLIGLELERLVCHISDIGGLCTDVGFGVAAAYATRIKESLLRASAKCCGTRYWRRIAIPGGLRFDFDSAKLAELGAAVASASRDFKEMARLVLETPSIQDRFEAAGILSQEAARDLAVVGPVARASGINLDVRRDHPYAHYGQHRIEVPVTHYGDVMARARIRIAEAEISTRLIGETVTTLTDGGVFTPLTLQGDAQGFAAVESPRCELCYWIEIRRHRITRCHVKSPSFQNWPAMPLAVAGNIIADFPLINKSFNLSYSGCDR